MNVRFKTNLEVTANFFQSLSKNFSLKTMLTLSSVASFNWSCSYFSFRFPTRINRSVIPLIVRVTGPDKLSDLLSVIVFCLLFKTKNETSLVEFALGNFQTRGNFQLIFSVMIHWKYIIIYNQYDGFRWYPPTYTRAST